MIRRVALAAALVLLIAGCGGELGVGLPECEEVPRRPTPAMILSAQAVPSAEYAPCIDELALGWDGVTFQVERGRAQVTVGDGLTPFLTVQLTPACTASGDGPLPTGNAAIEKYEDITTEVGSTVRVVLIPTGDRPLVWAGAITRDYFRSEIDDRLVEFTLDRDMGLDVRDRVSRAFFDADFVWIVDELDAVENTVQVRTPDLEVGAGLTPDDALNRMKRYVDDPAYRGSWYYTFVGGCITYEFAAGGMVAESIADDVTSAFGFYDLDALRDLARRNGVVIEQLPPPEE